MKWLIITAKLYKNFHRETYIPSHFLDAISANGYTVSNYTQYTCVVYRSEKGSTPFHIKQGKTAIGYPFHTYTMYYSHRNPQLFKLKINIVIEWSSDIWIQKLHLHSKGCAQKLHLMIDMR